MVRILTAVVVVSMLAMPVMAQERMEGNVFGPEAGNWELTLGGGGASDQDFESGSAFVNGSLGYYLDDNWEVVFRQGFGFADSGDSSWNASSRIGIDYNFNFDRLVPYIGANVGIIYGDDIDDTGIAGLGGGLKWFVKPETFIFAGAEYQFFFEDSDDADDNFDDGSFVYTLGIGFVW